MYINSRIADAHAQQRYPQEDECFVFVDATAATVYVYNHMYIVNFVLLWSFFFFLLIFDGVRR